MSTRLIAASLFALLLPVAFVPWGGAAQAARPAETRRCVGLRDIDRTTIADDRTILFYMKNHAIYENRLPHACPGLERQGKFMYRVALDQLCDVDTINVLEDYGFAFVQGAACGLGVFAPIEPAAAEALLSRKGAPRR